MRPGYAVYNRRFAPFSAEIAPLIADRMSAILTVIFFGLIVAAQAQESVAEAAPPAWTEPTLPSSEAAPATEAAPLPSAPEPLPSTPTEPLPSSSAHLP